MMTITFFFLTVKCFQLPEGAANGCEVVSSTLPPSVATNKPFRSHSHIHSTKAITVSLLGCHRQTQWEYRGFLSDPESSELPTNAKQIWDSCIIFIIYHSYFDGCKYLMDWIAIWHVLFIQEHRTLKWSLHHRHDDKKIYVSILIFELHSVNISIWNNVSPGLFSLPPRVRKQHPFAHTIYPRIAWG